MFHDVLYTCNPGYKFTDSSNLSAKCMSSGSFEGVDLINCERVSCGEPPLLIDNGEASFKYEDTLYEGVVTYTCNEG